MRMDIQKAVEIIKRKSSIPMDDESFDEICEAYDLAVEALEKQLPKKPIVKRWCPAICPTCKRTLSESKGDGYWQHYTSLSICDCGQKLDWSEV